MGTHGRAQSWRAGMGTHAPGRTGLGSPGAGAAAARAANASGGLQPGCRVVARVCSLVAVVGCDITRQIVSLSSRVPSRHAQADADE
jgi:hypothetical protein